PGARGDSGAARDEGSWRLLVELADVLGGHVFPVDALPDVCHWLADATDSHAAILLLSDSGVIEVVTWPNSGPTSVEMAALAGRPLDPQSGLWEAVRDGRTVVAEVGRPVAMPAGVSAQGAVAAVPLVAGDMTFGVVLMHQPDADVVPDQGVALLEDVAPRIALALDNAERASQDGSGLSDDAVAEVSLATLSAVAILLHSLEALPAPPRHDPVQAARYDEIARNATKLRDQVELYLDQVTS
ncbi:MAG: GAF domain-containing protein, partial [Actinomycetota bacterium]|nr:GAF domain-containing protein [Actinomycetota bacterium]